MHKPSRSSTVCPPMMPFVAYSFPRPLWESKCRRDTGLVLHCAARQNDFSSPAEALARIELLSRRGSSRDGAPQNACFEGYVCEHVLCGELATATAAALRQRYNVASSWAMDLCRRLQPLGTRPKHTQHCAGLEFAPSSWLVCVGF